MNRRSLLTLLPGANKLIPSESAQDFKYKKQHKPTNSTLAPYTGNWTKTQVAHLLKRTTFGIRPGDIEMLLPMSCSDAVDYMLSQNLDAPYPPVNDYGETGKTDGTGVLYGTTWVNSDYGDGLTNYYRINSLKIWWNQVICNHQLSIAEKMIFFWHNHYVTESFAVLDALYSYRYYQILRTNCLGNFREFTRAITKSSAMLRYLNGFLSIAAAPDENYARELQELFTVGKFNDPNYTENDIKAAARILTGWTVSIGSSDAIYTPNAHDTNDKVFSEFYNNHTIVGKSGTSGKNETDELIDMIFTKREAAHFLATKLYRYFVYYEIDANIETNIIQPLTDTIFNNNFELLPFMKQLLKSEHFFDASFYGCLDKSPLEHAYGCIRNTGTTLPATTDCRTKHNIFQAIADELKYQNLNLGDPPNVAGWPAYYISPTFNEQWINASSMASRTSFINTFLNEGYSDGSGDKLVLDPIGFAEQCPTPDNANLLIEWMSDIFFGFPVKDSITNNALNILISGTNNTAYWTAAWEEYKNQPNEETKNTLISRLVPCLNYLLKCPEYHLS